MTLRRLSPLLLITAALPLSACNWFGGGSSSDTEMKNVEILPGTASDEMVTLDSASGDGTALDTSTAIGPVSPGATAKGSQEGGAAADDSADQASDAAPSSDGGDTSGDVVIRPPAGGPEPTTKAAPPTPAKK